MSYIGNKQSVALYDSFTKDQSEDTFAPITRSRKNLLINGCFRISQRTGPFTNSGTSAYSVDRWSLWRGDGLGQVTGTKESLALPDGREVPCFTLSASNLSGQTTYGMFLNQPVEDPNQVSGKTVTISGYVHSDIATTLNWRTYTKVNNVSENVVVKQQSLEIGLNRIELSASVPVLAYSTGASDFFACQLYTPPNVNGTVKYAELQLEIGDTATDFERRPIGEELALCQRYFYLSAGQFQYTSQEGSVKHYPLPTTMRAGPSIYLGGGHTSGGSINRIRPDWVTFTDLSGGDVQFTADAEL